MGRPSKYPPEFRREAALLVLTSDRSLAEIARELGVHHKTLGGWVALERGCNYFLVAGAGFDPTTFGL